MKTPALTKSIQIIDLLLHKSMTTGEILEALALPKSSVYNLLNQLKEERILAQDSTGRYSLGLKLLEWGNSVSAYQDLREIAHGHLKKLAIKTSMLCHLGILDNDTPIYLMRVDSLPNIQVKTWEGKQLSIYRSSLGKCLLSFLGEDRQRAILNSITIENHLPNSINSIDALKQEIESIKAQGWAKDDEEDALNILCVSAPVIGANGKAIAAISLVGTVIHIGNNFTFEDAAQQVMETAATISKEIGFKGELQ